MWWLIDCVQALRQLHSAALAEESAAATLAAAVAAVRDAALQPTGPDPRPPWPPPLPTLGHVPAPALMVWRTRTSEDRHLSVFSVLFGSPRCVPPAVSNHLLDSSERELSSLPMIRTTAGWTQRQLSKFHGRRRKQIDCTQSPWSPTRPAADINLFQSEAKLVLCLSVRPSWYFACHCSRHRSGPGQKLGNAIDVEWKAQRSSADIPVMPSPRQFPQHHQTKTGRGPHAPEAGAGGH